MRHLMMLALLGASLLAAPVQAADLSELSKSERADAIRFSVNNSLFTLYHEVAHLLIDQMSLPVLGREEDAADNMATWMLLEQNTPEANLTLEDAAEGWMMSGVRYGEFIEEDYAYGYSPDQHRSLQIVCLMVGANGSAFRPVANAYSMQPDRQHGCRFEYDLIDRSMQSLLRKSGSGTEVEVTYQETGRRLRTAARALKSSGIFDDVAEEVRKGYRLDREVTFTAQSCGEANAFYDPTTVEVIFCYELIDDFLGMYADKLRDGEAHERR